MCLKMNQDKIPFSHLYFEYIQLLINLDFYLSFCVTLFTLSQNLFDGSAIVKKWTCQKARGMKADKRSNGPIKLVISERRKSLQMWKTVCHSSPSINWKFHTWVDIRLGCSAYHNDWDKPRPIPEHIVEQ